MNFQILLRPGYLWTRVCGADTRPARLRRSLAGLAALTALAGAPAGVHATPFDELSPTVQAGIIQRCLPVRYDAGVNAWRSCIDNESAAAGESGASSSTSVSALDLDERFALRKLCEASTDPDCTARELIQLSRTPAPQLGDLRDDERHALARACFVTQSTGGPAAWRQCMTNEAERLRTAPPVDLEALGLAQRNEALNACSGDTSVIGYRECLAQTGAPLAGTGSAVAVLPTPQGSTTEPVAPDTSLQTIAAAEPTATTDSIKQAAIDAELPQLAAAQAKSLRDLEPVVPVDSTTDNTADQQTAVEVPASTPATDTSSEQSESAGVVSTDATVSDTGSPPADPAPGLVDRMSAAVADLDPIGRATLLAAAALPLLALLGIVVTRRRSGERAAAGSERLIDRVHTTPDRSHFDTQRDAQALNRFREDTNTDNQAIRERFEDEADDLFNALESTIASTPLESAPADAMASAMHKHSEIPGADDTFADDMGGAHDLSWEEPDRLDLQEAYEPSPAENARPATEAPTRLVTAPEFVSDTHAHAATPPARATPFIDWLMSEPESLRFQHTVELLVYWTAYADDRYDPEVRQTVLSSTDPSAHDRIKTWALLKDAHALSGGLRWLLHNSSREQRVQVLELIVALLVTDPDPTPAQNTLIRFLSDVFGLGEDRLNQLWNESFGCKLAPLPRVDRRDWWDRQDTNSMQEREPRGLGQLPDQQQYRLQLGLPLHGAVSAGDVNTAWSRASARCLPARFDALGERERKLAERQLQRFNDARVGLLEQIPDAADQVERNAT